MTAHYPYHEIGSDPDRELPMGPSTRIRLLSSHLTPIAAGTHVIAHEHAHWELSFMIRGSMTTFCDGTGVLCRADNAAVFCVPPGVIHRRIFSGETENCNLTLLFLPDRYLPVDDLAERCLRNGFCFQVKGFLRELLTEIRHECRNNGAENAVLVPLIHAFLLKFLHDELRLSERNVPHDPQSFHQASPAKKAESISKFLLAHLNDPKISGSLSSYFHLSVRQLNRIFRRHYGVTVFEGCAKMRIERAKYLLKNSTLSVAEIAAGTGFASTAGFHLAFRKQCGTTPQGWRRGRPDDPISDSPIRRQH